MGRTGATVAIAVVMLLPSAAHGQNDAEARRAYQKGDALYVAGKYDEALVELTRAYELSSNPELLFNMATRRPTPTC